MHADAGNLQRANPALAGRWWARAWIALLLVIGLYMFGWLAGVERVIKDSGALLTRHMVDSDVVLIDIDAKSLRQLNTWPWPRRYHAQLLDRLQSASPALVVFDIDFSSASNPEDDAEFSRALGKWRKKQVALVAFLQYADSEKGTVVANYPIPILRKHAQIASINLFPAGDGLVRSVSLRDADHPPNAPPLAKLLHAGSDLPNDLLIDYSIDPKSIQHLSYADVLEGRFDPAQLKGKKIIVGATAIELRDQVAVPLHQILPGPVVQALAYESLRSGALQRPPGIVNVVALVLFGAIIIALMSRLEVFPRLIDVLLAVPLIFGAGLALRWMAGYQIDVSPFMLFIIAAYVVRQVAHIDRQSVVGLTQKLLLKRKQEQIDAINNNVLEGMLSVDAAGRIVSANHACSVIFSCALNDVIGRSLIGFFPTLIVGQGGVAMPEIRKIDGRFDIVGRRANGEALYADLAIEKSAQGDGEVSMIFMRDVSQLMEKQALLDFQAIHDPSTGLLNKYGFLIEVDAAIENHIAVRPHALLVVGVRSMMAVSHELGHQAGEYLFKSVADLVVGLCARRGGVSLAARIAPDEFGLWIEGGEDVVNAYAGAITCLLDEPLQVDQIQVKVNLAIGAAIYPRHAGNASDILRLASIAMRDVDGSESAFNIFNDEQTALVLRKLTLSSQLREAIVQGGLRLYFQPKLDMRTNCITSVEALARWNHAELGFVSPDEFIQIAEETGVIKQLTAWAFETAVCQHLHWIKQGVDLRVAVNISSKLLTGDVLLEILDKAAATHPALASALILEITESAIMDNRQAACALLGDLSSRGYRLSLDDFGTGQSSFAYLKDLPVQELKIDKSFVMGMAEQQKDAQIVSSIITLAHGLGMEVVAEGIESQAILDLLKQQGCEYGQGYFIGKPVPAEELTLQLTALGNKVQSALVS